MKKGEIQKFLKKAPSYGPGGEKRHNATQRRWLGEKEGSGGSDKIGEKGNNF